MAMDLESGGKKGKKSRPEMNVTPLVDVVLVLLIIFMVMTPMMLKHFSVVLPPEAPDAPSPADAEQPIVVSLNSEGTIRINRDEVADTELVGRLRRVLAARATRTIVFDAHDDASYARAVAALDLARSAGATRIAVATEALPGID
jgi:biopolymer transport protein ExbD/biopolymer transport protein TolR